jgi:hypothetical protein
MTSNVYRLTIDGNFSEKLKSLKKIYLTVNRDVIIFLVNTMASEGIICLSYSNLST